MGGRINRHCHRRPSRLRPAEMTICEQPNPFHLSRVGALRRGLASKTAIIGDVATVRLVRLARALWVALAVVVWNVVLDQTLVLAGRRYIVAAVGAAQGPGPYARIDDWMRPALVQGFWSATAAAAAILTIGLVAVRVAARSGRSTQAS